MLLQNFLHSHNRSFEKTDEASYLEGKQFLQDRDSSIPF